MYNCYRTHTQHTYGVVLGLTSRAAAAVQRRLGLHPWLYTSTCVRPSYSINGMYLQHVPTAWYLQYVPTAMCATMYQPTECQRIRCELRSVMQV